MLTRTTETRCRGGIAASFLRRLAFADGQTLRALHYADDAYRFSPRALLTTPDTDSQLAFDSLTTSQFARPFSLFITCIGIYTQCLADVFCASVPHLRYMRTYQSTGLLSREH